jgi:anti-sigma factor RsiW
MMTDQPPGERPGHLDIDAVSAFVDRDLEADDFATIEFHLTHCPACHREVLEIRTTVLLLSSLPQYAPRRSFCLGQEHARAARRRHLAAREAAARDPFQPASARAVHGAPARGGGPATAWLPGLQVAAVAIGALLFFVTTWDIATIPAAQQAQLAAPVAMNAQETAPAPAALLPTPLATHTAPPLAPAVASDSDTISAPSAFQPEPSQGFAARPADSGGTTEGERASQEIAADEAPPPALAVASVTGAVTTPPAMTAREQPAVTTPAATDETVANPVRPSWLSMAQLMLALLLAWLVVSITGLRRIRR